MVSVRSLHALQDDVVSGGHGSRVPHRQTRDKRITGRAGMLKTHTLSMSLDAWRTFVAICRLGSLSAAAAELGYTQSAVSRQLAGLEREVGVPLMERHARGIRPTAAGEAFRPHAQATVNDAERA